MTRRYVDRGDPIRGINTTLRDSRVPYSIPRSLVNVSLFDGRIRRRPGIQEFGSQKFFGDVLSKHTSNTLEASSNVPGENDIFNGHFKCPASYALLKYHDDFQPRTDRDWTIEFTLFYGEIEPLVYNPQRRFSRNSYGSPAEKKTLRIDTAQESGYSGDGVYVYDQSVTSNFHNRDGYAVDPSDFTTTDSFALTALAVSYTASQIIVTSHFWDNGAETYSGVVLREPISYITTQGEPSQVFPASQIAIRYRADTREFSLSLNAQPPSASAVHTVGEEWYWAGETDYINGFEDVPIKRDIVLLNEYTVRGAMASTCKLDPTDTPGVHAYEILYDYRDPEVLSLDLPPAYWYSPPRGTGMAELRYWHSHRSDDELAVWYRRRLDVTETLDGLVGYWRLDDGSAVCAETYRLGGELPRLITVHQGDPGYVADINMPGGYAMVFADGQHLSKRYGEEDFNQIDDSHTVIRDILKDEPKGASASFPAYDPKNDFTVMMRIRCPHDFGQEINVVAGDVEQKDVWYGTAGKQETGRYAQNYTPYALFEGLVAPTTSRIRGAIPAHDANVVYHRAFDQTLWSIEGSVLELAGSTAGYNPDFIAQRQRDSFRVPLARGLLTPEGRVAFEFFGYSSGPGTGFPREFRLLSQSALTPGQAVTVTFRKETLKRNVGGDLVAYGWAMSIYFDLTNVAEIKVGGKQDGDPVDLTGGAVLASNPSPIASRTMPYSEIRGVHIGSSYVDDYSNRGVRWLNTSNADDEAKFVDTGHVIAWPQTERRPLSPWQDQPGYFSMGFFRMWSKSITLDEIYKYFNTIIGTDDVHRLLYNVEINRPFASQVSSITRFPALFESCYKGWGKFESNQTQSVRAYVGWGADDRLGYLADSGVFASETDPAQCNGLSIFSSTLEQRYGLFSVFGGSALYDANLSGSARHVVGASLGMLNDYRRDGVWRGTSIADKLILTSTAGRPKVFNGKTLTTLGHRPYVGGRLRLKSEAIAGVSSGFLAGLYYGVRVVYYSEYDAITHVSPQSVIQIVANNHAIVVPEVYPHPDPRVTSFYLAVTTQGYDTELEAAVAPVVPVSPSSQNLLTGELAITGIEEGTAVDTTRSTFPSCAYSASAYNRLYLAGDPVVPDVIYYSELGQPESINTALNRFTIPDSDGDQIVSIITFQGVLWAFKPNSIWRITDIGGDPVEHDRQKISSVGPASPDGMALITIPDSGRTAIAFWSKHGPYLFDGVNVQYIGNDIEGEDGFDWVNSETVNVLHDVQRRELIFFYQAGCSTQQPCHCVLPDYLNSALIFNYRTGSWVQATGMFASRAISATVTKTVEIPGTAPFGQPIGVSSLATTVTSVPLFGGVNGRLYLWGRGDHDALPPAREYRLRVTDYDAEAREITFEYIRGEPAGSGYQYLESELVGLWVTIVKESGEDWFVFPVSANTDTTITIAQGSCGSSIPFDPGEDDKLYVCMPAMHIIFPWDQMESPYFEKQAHRLTTWSDGSFLHRLAHSWDEKTFSLWRVAPDADTKRQHVELHVGNSESFKLELASVDPDARLDSYGYTVTDTGDALNRQ